EKSGLQPAAARISALLLVSDKLELTFDEIRENLNLSKSATSNALNLLINLNRATYVTKPGERKRYFKSNIDDWENVMEGKYAEFEESRALMKEVLDQRPHATKEFNANLENIIDLLEFINMEVPKLFMAWKKKKG